MIRTQIQLTEQQSRALKDWAVSEGKSVAELIRISIDTSLATRVLIDKDEKWERALSVAGKFHFPEDDLSEAHDRYLVEAYGA